MRFHTTRLITLIGCAVSALLAGCEAPPPIAEQQGYRGTGMVAIANPGTVDARASANAAPEALAPVDAGGPPAASTYTNVKVLNDLGVAEFTRLMVAMTNWVSPEQGCNYCHAGTDFASDAPYAKVVARRMLQMTREINSQWKDHVGTTGVTCYTCHRGQPVPAGLWVLDPGPKQAGGMARGRAGQNVPATAVGLTSLPYDPFAALLSNSGDIRVVSAHALPAGGGQSIVATEQTYGLMMHISGALGVNCTFCHNSRSFAEWEQSSPQRVTAWHGLRMVKSLNANYLDPLHAQLPAGRLGPMGDAPKLNCATCHQGLSRPLNGAAMLTSHPELAAAKAPLPSTPDPADVKSAPATTETK